jgi:hypothetical protein
MEITQDNMTRIIEIMESFYCHQYFPCFRSEFKNLCKFRFIGEGIVECLDEKAKTCNHHFNSGHGYFCKCPLRLYLANTFNK